MMLFLDNNGNVVYSKEVGIEEDLIEGLYDELLFNNKKLSSTETGLLYVKNRVFLIAKSPITQSSDNSVENGSLVLVREFDEELLNYIKNVVKADFKILNSNEAYNENFKNFESLDYDIKIQKQIESTEGYKMFSDIYGNNSLMFSIKFQHGSHNYVSYYFKLFMLGYSFLLIILLFLDYLIINKQMFKRITKFMNFMEYVATTKDTSLHLEMTGNDEIYDLSNSANKMLSALNNANKLIKKRDERFKLIMEATNDGYLDFYVKAKQVYISHEWKTSIGYEGEENQLFQNYISKIHPECIERLKSKYFNVLNGELDYFYDEYRVIKNSGEVIWVLHRGKVSEKDNMGTPLRIVSTLLNITDRKKYEQEILYLSYSDKLTGLKNRAYMEKEFETLDENKESNFIIIMGDLNGLKQTNDSLGHKEGDRLLCTTSEILKNTCREDDIISRWGGDEFVILVKHKDKGYVSNLIDSIKDSCDKINDFQFKISIALGYAEKDSEHLDTESIMSLAEKRMYRNKLMEHTSSRNATISSLLRTLHEKHSETEQHTMRIKFLSLELGKLLALSKDKLDELELLSLLHDIGKIGIPENILLKPSKLTSDEWTIMKTHTEIGYRIAKSTPTLEHIAYEILSHHEKYDGTGYPNGLKGEEIPLLARIINIVDSFDVMTHKRVYKEASDRKYAEEELKRCSGSQFDPLIVDKFLNLLKKFEITND